MILISETIRAAVFLILLLGLTGYKLKTKTKFQTNNYVSKCSLQINSTFNCDSNSKYLIKNKNF